MLFGLFGKLLRAVGQRSIINTAVTELLLYGLVMLHIGRADLYCTVDQTVKAVFDQLCLVLSIEAIRSGMTKRLEDIWKDPRGTAGF